MSPRTDAPGWRWGNIPIPEAHLVGLGMGILLQVVTPWSLPWPAWIGHGCGWPLTLAGLWLGAWAVRAAAGVDLERPNQLVDSGPYAYGRNPMYVAWTVGVALVAGTAWPLLLLRSCWWRPRLWCYGRSAPWNAVSGMPTEATRLRSADTSEMGFITSGARYA